MKPDLSPLSGGLLSSVTSLLADFEVPEAGPALGSFSPDEKDLFAERSRSAWSHDVEARCNFEPRPRLTHRAGVWFLSLWQKSVMGRTLSDIKADPGEISHFAAEMAGFLSELLGSQLRSGAWAICTTPKRRHKEHNFASLISDDIARRLGIPFYEDVALCRSRQRVGATFSLNILPAEPNVIVFDDFVTTGSTLKAMHSLLAAHGKNTLFVAGINNKL